jgi:hypothetical protein
VKLNLQQPPPPSTKIKLHVPQKLNSPPVVAPSPPAVAPVKNESPILAPQPLPPPPQSQVRQSSPLKNQITASPSKSPPSLRPAPPKSLPLVPQNKDLVLPMAAWARTPQVLATIARHTIRPAPQTVPPRTGVVIPPSQENGVRQPLHNLMIGNKRERNLTLIPLVTLSTSAEHSSPTQSSTSASSTPQPSSTALLLSVTSTTPPAPSTQTICLTVPKYTNELVLNAYLAKDLTLQGSYTFTVTSNGRKLSPTLWPDASRRSGTTDSIAVAPRGTTPTTPNGLGDAWRFSIALGDYGSITTIEAGCTAFLKRDERGLLVRGERSRTGQAAGEDGGELERVVIIVLRGR